MQGVFINGIRPKSKAAVKRAIADPNSRIRVEATSMMGNEFDGMIEDAPSGQIYFVGPDPYTKRNFYGTFTVSRDNENAVVIKVT